MHPLTTWRMLPPAGVPLRLGAVIQGLWLSMRGSTEHMEALRETVRVFTGLPYVALYGSGREALARLFTVLRTNHAEKTVRDEVLLPAYGSFTLPAAVVRAGCRVGLYDVDPATLAPRLDSVAEALSSRTVALVACRQYGFSFDLAPLATLCRAAGATLVDDAAQALGGRTPEGQAGTLGDVGLFSLGRGKNITAMAGGILVTRNADLARDLESTSPDTLPADIAHTARTACQALALWGLRNPALYRLPASLPWLGIGASTFEPTFADRPFGILQAELALDGLRRLPGLTSGRRATAAWYASWMRDKSALQVIESSAGAEPVFPRFPFLFTGGGATENWLAEARAAGVSPGFPLALHEIPDLAPHLTRPGQDYPGAAFLARRLFTLPTHEQVTARDRSRVLRCLERLEYLQQSNTPARNNEVGHS